jgi:ribosomal protein S27AE
MAQLFGKSFGGPYFDLVLVIIVLVVAVTVRLYLIHNPGRMRAKCKKCGSVFDTSRTFSIFHIGSLKMLTCPACGKTSLMNSHVKDPINWPAEDKKEEQQTQRELSQDELEQKRIEESKYERAQS